MLLVLSFDEREQDLRSDCAREVKARIGVDSQCVLYGLIHATLYLALWEWAELLTE